MKKWRVSLFILLLFGPNLLLGEVFMGKILINQVAIGGEVKAVVLKTPMGKFELINDQMTDSDSWELRELEGKVVKVLGQKIRIKRGPLRTERWGIRVLDFDNLSEAHTYQGHFKSKVVAIGAETSGYILVTKDGPIDLNFSKSFDQSIDMAKGRYIEVHGKLAMSKGVGRPDRLVLKVDDFFILE
jgi:hypothetical protein